MEAIAELLQALDEGRPVALVTVVTGDHVGGKALVGEGGLLWSDAPVERLPAMAALGDQALREEQPRLAGDLYAEPYTAAPGLVICGAGHVGQAVAAMAALAGFRVTVIDDRAEFARPDRFPAGTQVIAAPFDEALHRVNPGPGHFVVLATRGHHHDFACLRQVLESAVPYIGMIGSRRRIGAVLDLLKAEGVEAGERLYAPIGLDIGANNPAEIAVATVAELIRVRRGGSGEHLSRLQRPLVHQPETRRATTEVAVLRQLLAWRAAGEPAALATVVHTRGHCPREAGAKLAISRLGAVVGTIGGGCGEAEVRRLALDVMDSGQPLRHVVDLLDDPAVPDGAVCGGRMEILIEPVGLSALEVEP